MLKQAKFLKLRNRLTNRNSLYLVLFSVKVLLALQALFSVIITKIQQSAVCSHFQENLYSEG